MRITLIKNLVVENIIECVSLEKAQALYGSGYICSISGTEQIDDLYNATSQTFTPTVAPNMKILTKYQFLSKFTTTELVAIYSKASTDPIVNVFIKKLELSEEVQLFNPEISLGLDYLIAQSVIVANRKSQILS